MAERAFQATVIEVRSGSSYDLIIAREFPDQPLTEGWYPTKDLDKFKVGDSLTITPLTKMYESGGSLTIFQLEKS